MFKNFIKKINSSFNGFEYVVDVKILEEYLKNELKFSLENNIESCVNLSLFYKGEKHLLNIWNFSASNFSDERSKGLSITFDDKEFYNIDYLINNAIVCNHQLVNLNDFFVIELDIDSEFLKNYKFEHPELKIEDYK